MYDARATVLAALASKSMKLVRAMVALTPSYHTWLGWYDKGGLWAPSSEMNIDTYCTSVNAGNVTGL